MSSEIEARIRIKSSGGEVEISGSEEFVRESLGRIDELLSSVERAGSGLDPSMERNVDEDEAGERPRSDERPSSEGRQPDVVVPDTFGEFYHRFLGNLGEQEKALIAAYFIQLKDPNTSFNTAAVNAALLEQGEKLSNPSASIKRNVENRRVFAVKQGVYRVSKAGIEYLKSLVG